MMIDSENVPMGSDIGIGNANYAPEMSNFNPIFLMCIYPPSFPSFNCRYVLYSWLAG